MPKRLISPAVDALYAPRGALDSERPPEPRVPGVVEIRIPLRTQSQAHGVSSHWRVQSGRRKREHGVTWAFLGQHRPPALPCVVTLVRLAPCELDSDNLSTSFKAIRDEVAKWLGLPTNTRGHAEDRDPRVHWTYMQGKDKPREYAVIVRAETSTQVMVDAKRRQEEWRP